MTMKEKLEEVFETLSYFRSELLDLELEIIDLKTKNLGAEEKTQEKSRRLFARRVVRVDFQS